MAPRPTVDADLVAYLGDLAKLILPADRREDLTPKLAALVEAFSSLAAADLGDDVDDGPAAEIHDLRPDRAAPAGDAAAALQNAPQTAADCFVVPRVVDP
jgi:aspartyl/glutamyl-tRNA(Asn/Gln) amidotransferase C subunit